MEICQELEIVQLNKRIKLLLMRLAAQVDDAAIRLVHTFEQ